jgi:acyl dehydratase
VAPNLDAIGRKRVLEREWTSRDAMLYALAVGAGQDDCTTELEFTTDNSEGIEQRVLPTFAALLEVPTTLLLSATDRELGADEIRGFVHGEHAVQLHRPLPPNGRATVTGAIRAIYDKGSGALIESVSEVRERERGELLATLVNGTFARGAGGFGGPRGESPEWRPPARDPDARRVFELARNQALLYRLTGDRHPLHSDPAYARAAGFRGPIVHGLTTYGFSARALVQEVCGGDAGRFGAIRARFTRPVYPGETIEVAIWRTDDGALFRTSTAAGVALDHGTFRLAEP